jgi:uncharacterized protein (TIGR03435 family)
MGTSRLALKSALATVIVTAILAQSPAPRPAFDSFEVASIKPTPGDWTGGRWIRMQSTLQFAARNHTLKTLVAAAYQVSPRAISGSVPWMENEGWDITAKVPGDLRPNLNEQMAMLRKLLTERFKLSFHHEQKELQYFALTIAKGGPKFKESTVSPDATPEGPPPLIFVVSPEVVRLPGRNATMGELASVMQRAALDHPVLDRTGLTGRYDFDLEWSPDETQFGGALGKGTDNPTRPDLYGALQQQLGLKLETAKGPVEVLVIDSAVRPAAG